MSEEQTPLNETKYQKDYDIDKLGNELLEAVYSNYTSSIRALIENYNSLLRHRYKQNGKSILLIACSDNDVNAETVAALLNLNANPRDYTNGDGWEALHWAATSTNYNILNILLEKYPENINTVDKHGNNALHILIRYGDKNSQIFENCVQLLIQKGIDVNKKNLNNMTPIQWAIKNELKSNIVELLKDKGRQLKSDGNEGHILLKYLIQGYEDQFVNFKNGEIEDWVNYTEESHTLLQICCEKDLTKAAIHLLDKGANPEKTSKKNDKPIIIAANRGNKKIFEALLDKYSKITEIPGELLPAIVKYIDRESPYDNIGCYRVFMEKMKKSKKTELDEVYYKVNEGDEGGNTALHYAVVYAKLDVIEELLSLGASLGARNKNGIMPIQNIEAEILKNHLNKTVEFDLRKRKIDREEFEVKFNHRTLIPPYMQLHSNQQTPILQKKLIAETEVIDYMSETLELKKLLTHPTITSYLYLKWLKIQWIFWINLAFYIIFASSLLIYALIDQMTDKSIFCIIAATILYVIFSIGTLIIFFRELFQIIVAPKKYFINIENYIELFLIVLSVMTGLNINPTSKKGLFALTSLLSAFELVLLLGHYPKFSTNVVMFRTVAYNFYKYLVLYSLPIFAFAISFYLVFATDSNESNDTNTYVINNEEELFAQYLTDSVFKTIIMLSGEFNSGDLNFKTYPFISKIIFAAFVYTIVIILLNLLIGLAVSDTQIIRNEAELVGYVARTQFITGIESMLKVDISMVKYAQRVIDMTNSLPIIRNWNYSLGQNLLRFSCIFPDDFNYEVTFYPRKGGLIKPSSSCERTKYVNYSNVHLDHNIVQRTNSIIQEKINDEQIADKRKKLENSINSIEDKQDLLTNKLDTLLTLINALVLNK